LMLGCRPCIYNGLVERFRLYIDYHFLGGQQRQEALLLQKRNNMLHRYDFPAENNGWRKVGETPVYGDSITGTIFDPQVILYEGRFVMTASERKSNSIILLISNDGEHWNHHSMLLFPVKGSWETVVNRSCLRIIKGVWHLWYTGQAEGKSVIGHLTSSSLDKFDRPRYNVPVLTPTLEIEGVSIMNPCVLWDEQNEKFKMWYAAGEQYEPDVIMYAESYDGTSWEKHPNPVLAKYPKHEWEQEKVGGCDVIQMPNGSFVMYYIGYQNIDVARICYATSDDGIHWERPDNNYCLSPSPDAWDADAVYKPAIVEKDGTQHLWYNGRRGSYEYIGLAIKEVCPH